MDNLIMAALLDIQEAISQASKASNCLFLSMFSIPKEMRRSRGYKARKKADKLIHKATDAIYKAQDILLKEVRLPEKNTDEKHLYAQE